MDIDKNVDDKNQTHDEDFSGKKTDFVKVMGEFLNNLLDVFPEVTSDIEECKKKKIKN
jgi:hypothetical protein